MLTCPKLTTSDPDDVYVRAAFNYVDAINDAVRDPSPLAQLRLRDCMSPDSIVELHPSSMIPQGRRDNLNTADDQIQYLVQMRSIVKEANAKAKGVSHKGQAYTNDYVFFISFADFEGASADDLTDLERQRGVQARAGLPKATFTREYVDSAFIQCFVEEEARREWPASL
ncbi:hypothetical protein IE53DRAFT_185177 [Violaceomyces palustris]|uniref:Uncharacterized protein n=1 Tax=Violaceomyces palustris TaxID=1673888 RepID=A0ACD0NS61_9BASI|nr:hypothetical protein IE53DRAFT_185177 [Violaceomyces palustris]